MGLFFGPVHELRDLWLVGLKLSESVEFPGVLDRQDCNVWLESRSVQAAVGYYPLVAHSEYDVSLEFGKSVHVDPRQFFERVIQRFCKRLIHFPFVVASRFATKRGHKGDRVHAEL